MSFLFYCSVIMQHPVCLQMGVALVCIKSRGHFVFQNFDFCEVGSAARPPALTWLPRIGCVTETLSLRAGLWKCLLCNEFSVLLLRYNATDIHTMNDHLWSLLSGFYTQIVRPTTSLWVQNAAKSALKGTLFA